MERELIRSIDIQESFCSSTNSTSTETLCTKQDIAVSELREVKIAQVAPRENNEILGCKRKNLENILNISISKHFQKLRPDKKIKRLSLNKIHLNSRKKSTPYNVDNFSPKSILISKDISSLKLNKLKEDRKLHNEADSHGSLGIFHGERNNQSPYCIKELSEQVHSDVLNSCIPDLSTQNVEKIFSVDTDIQLSLSESNPSSQDNSESPTMDVSSQGSLNSERMEISSQGTNTLNEDTAFLEINKQIDTEFIQNGTQAVEKSHPSKEKCYCGRTKRKTLRIRRREMAVTKREIDVKDREARVAVREAAVLSCENSLRSRAANILNYEAAVFYNT